MADDLRVPRVMPPAVGRALDTLLGFRDRPRPVELYDAMREKLAPDPLGYAVLAPSQIPGPPILVAAARSAEDAQVIARALEKAAGRPKDSYRVIVRQD